MKVVKPGDELERLIISQQDLLQAKSFAEFILSKNLHDRSTDWEEQKLIHLAFNTSLIVSYSRPFTGNRGISTGKQQSVGSKLLEVLSKEEKRLHDNLTRSRHAEYAHSDLNSHNVSIYACENFAIPIGRNPFVPIEIEQIRQLIAIIDRLLTEISLRRSHLEEKDVTNLSAS